MSSLACRLCGSPITFDNKHISQRTGKKIPLDPGTNEPHDCPVRRDQQQPEQHQHHHQERRYYQCRKGCGQLIYFDANDVNGRTESGKWIPLSKDTREPHQCLQQ